MAGEGNSKLSLEIRCEDLEEELPEYLRISPSDIQMGKQIGSGGFSTVHKASWRGQAYAAKVVQTTDVRAIQKEVTILSKLDHPHVIRCIGFSVDSTGDRSRCMILMELMDEDLRHVMNRRLARKWWSWRSRVPFSESEAVDILEQIAAGMKYLHSHRVFHGDLKASNILVSHGPDGKMHVKITDFGVSQMVKRDPAENSEEFLRTKHFRGAVGTRGYQAPEVSSSSSTVNGQVGTAFFRAPESFLPGSNEFYSVKADTYCFAMTCYEILSGRVPFEDVRKPDIAELVLLGVRPVLPQIVNQCLVELIEQCWHQKPSKRPGFEEIRSSLVDYSPKVQHQEGSNGEKASTRRRKASAIRKKASVVGEKASAVGMEAFAVGKRAFAVGKRASAIGKKAGKKASTIGQKARKKASAIGTKASVIGKKASTTGKNALTAAKEASTTRKKASTIRKQAFSRWVFTRWVDIPCTDFQWRLPYAYALHATNEASTPGKEASPTGKETSTTGEQTFKRLVFTRWIDIPCTNFQWRLPYTYACRS